MSTQDLLQPDRGQAARSIELVAASGFDTWLNAQPPRTRAAVAAQKMKGKAGNSLTLPGESDDWSVVLATPDGALGPWDLAKLAESLPEGVYRLSGGDAGAAMLGWILGQYRFDRYRKSEGEGPRILLSSEPARMAGHSTSRPATRSPRAIR